MDNTSILFDTDIIKTISRTKESTSGLILEKTGNKYINNGENHNNGKKIKSSSQFDTYNTSNDSNCQENEYLTSKQPMCFTDLNLDQIINTITAGKDYYKLKPFFYTNPNNINTIKYRQEIAKDLENQDLLKKIKSFSEKMIIMRRYISMINRLSHKFHKKGWFLEAIIIYCDAVKCLHRDMSQNILESRGLLFFRNYLDNYIHSENFKSLFQATKDTKQDLSAIKYSITIKGNRVKVSKYREETDYSIEVEKTFEKFKHGNVKNHLCDVPVSSGMNHIEENILDLVVKLYPDIFSRLDKYCRENQNFNDKIINRFDREIQFYISYFDFIAELKNSGLKFCYPQITDTNKEVYNYEGFDLALANKLVKNKSTIICNDFHLKENERIFIVSGPNQGGKTTFARTFGQLHYLANLGLPVPGKKARLFMFDKIFTHFEKNEDIKNLRGKLQDDLIRIHYILNKATSKSIILLNEIFTSTTLQDAIFLSREIMKTIIKLDVLCVWVTFIDELASANEKTISMVSTVIPDNPIMRTFKIIRKPADGLAYALTIAEKYGVTYEKLKERIIK